jgi:hypothetical protein
VRVELAPAFTADAPVTASDQVENRTGIVAEAAAPAGLPDAEIEEVPGSVAVTVTEQAPAESVRHALPPTKLAPPEAPNWTSTFEVGAPPDLATTVTVVGAPVSESCVPSSSDELGDGDALGAGDGLEGGEALGSGDALAAGDALGDGDALRDGDVVADGDTLAEGSALADGDALGDGDALADGDGLAEGGALAEGDALWDGEALAGADGLAGDDALGAGDADVDGSGGGGVDGADDGVAADGSTDGELEAVGGAGAELGVALDVGLAIGVALAGGVGSGGDEGGEVGVGSSLVIESAGPIGAACGLIHDPWSVAWRPTGVVPLWGATGAGAFQSNGCTIVAPFAGSYEMMRTFESWAHTESVASSVCRSVML